MKQPCILDAHASFSSPTCLLLHYKVRNVSDQVLFLINRFWTSINPESQYQIQPNMANVVVGTNRVIISKTVVPVPDNMEVEYHYTPCLSRLGPNENWEETLEIAFPLVPFTWYQAPWDVPAFASEGVVRPLYFELGYLLVSPQNAAAMRSVDASLGPAYFRNIEPKDQLVISSGPLMPDIAISNERPIW